MTTSSFLAALRDNPELPLVFRAGRDVVSPGYHLTEVKRTAYETMDCGAMMHRWSETQFEIWMPALEKLGPGRGHMPAAKFLRIIDRVEAKLPLTSGDTARIFASFKGHPAALHEIESINARDGQLWVDLNPDRTRCKAAERRAGTPTSGCGGSNETAAVTGSEAGCGCSDANPGTKKEAAVASCCA